MLSRLYGLGRWVVSLALALFAALCLALLLTSNRLPGGVYTAAGCLAMALWALAVLLLGRALRKIPAFTWVLLGAGWAISLAAALLLNPPLQSDFQMLYDAAVSWLRGDTGFQQSVYFQLWAYQSAYVAWEALFLSIWQDPRMIQLVHSLLFAGTIVLLYRLLRAQIPETAARVTAVWMLSFPTFFTLPAVLTNQIPGAFFLCLGLWVLLSEDTRRLGLGRFPLAGLCLQLGNLMRPEGVLILAALAAAGILYLLTRPALWRRALLGGALLLAAYWLAGRAADLLVVASGLNANGLANEDPLWKFVLGLNPETGGTYSADDWALVVAILGPDNRMTEATVALERALIAQRLRQPLGSLLALALEKVDRLWIADPLSWALAGLSETEWWGLRAFCRAADRTLLGLALALTLPGTLLRRGHPREARGFVPHLVVLASFFAFLLIEVQPRYAYLPLLFLFCCAGHGLAPAGKRWLRWED